MMPHWYAYCCQPSNEVRGRRKNDHEKGCGRYNERGSNTAIDGISQKHQSRPCPECGKKQRLTPLNVIEPPIEVYTRRDEFSGRMVLRDNAPLLRKRWVMDYVQTMNRQREDIDSGGEDIDPE